MQDKMKRIISLLLVFGCLAGLYPVRFAPALSPKSRTAADELWTGENFKKVWVGNSVEEVFDRMNPRPLDLSKDGYFPVLGNKAGSLLFVNADKEIDHSMVIAFANQTFDLQSPAYRTGMDERYRSLFVGLEQFKARLYGVHFKSLSQYLSNEIRHFLSRRGYSWWKLGKKKRFAPAFVCGELLKNAVIHGNKMDLSKTFYLGWELEGDRFVIRVGDHGTGRLVVGKKGLMKVSGSVRSREFLEKLKVARTTMTTGESLGINGMQTFNYGAWEMELEPILNPKGEMIGKFITMTYPMEMLAVERQEKSVLLEMLKPALNAAGSLRLALAAA
jgi:hypothetical protein